MNVIVLRLGTENINDLIGISKTKGFPMEVNPDFAKLVCRGERPTVPMIQTYGAYVGNSLVGVITATYMNVFLHEDSPHGRIVHISGAFVLNEYRHQKIATEIMKVIESDSRECFLADYICCDTVAPEFFSTLGLYPTVEETRMWKSYINN